MAINPAILTPSQQLGTAAAGIYTCPVATRAIIKRAVFTNVSTGAANLTVYRVASGGSAGATNEVIAAMSLSAGQAYTAPELANMVLTPGDAIFAMSSVGSAINATMSGFTM